MIKFVSVREARRSFSKILLDAAYEKERTVVVRHRDTVAAVVSPDDLEFLLRYRPRDLRQVSDTVLEQDSLDLEERGRELGHRAMLLQRGGGSPDQLARLAAERALLAADESRLTAMLQLMKLEKN